jgi:hypothetical protein
MTVKTIRVKSLDGALARLEELALSNDEIVFRGHADSSWTICSTLSRYSVTPHQNWDTRIDDMLAHFATNLRSIGELPEGIAGDRRSRLEYGRHHGVPSPLIDFSLSPYIALFFAFNGVRPQKARQQVVVYALDVTRLALEWAKFITQLDPNRLNDEMNAFRYEQKDLFEHGYPASNLKFIRFPASWNKRMQRQMGVFIYDTLDYRQLGRRDLEDFIANLKETPDANSDGLIPILTKILIPAKAAREAFSRLELMGINATRLYDDAAGAAADVHNAYNYERKTGYAWDLGMPPPDDTKM